MESKTIIIGGGFAGRQAAKALCKAGQKPFLIDPRNDAVMLPALPDVAGGWIDSNALSGPLERWLPAETHHIRQRVQSIDLTKQTVETDQESIPFAQLIIAPGSICDFHGFDQHLDQVYPLDSLESALRIRTGFVDYLKESTSPHLLIAGGGYTGLELACSLRGRAEADGRPCRITIVDPSPQTLPFLPEKKRTRIDSFLSQSGIRIIREDKIENFDGTDATTSNGQSFGNVFFCWAGGSKLALPTLNGSAEQIRDGRIKVLPDLSIQGHPGVFVAGDAAAIESNGMILRKAVNFSWYSGLCAGKNMARLAAGKSTRPFRPFDAGWVIPLHETSVGQLFGHLWVGGRPGLRMHYLMCGFRNYRPANRLAFAKTAMTLFH